MKCDKCGKNHATWEHRIYEKIQLAKSGVPLETLFIMPDESTGNQKLDAIRNKIQGEVTK